MGFLLSSIDKIADLSIACFATVYTAKQFKMHKDEKKLGESERIREKNKYLIQLVSKLEEFKDDLTKIELELGLLITKLGEKNIPSGDIEDLIKEIQRRHSRDIKYTPSDFESDVEKIFSKHEKSDFEPYTEESDFHNGYLQPLEWEIYFTLQKKYRELRNFISENNSIGYISFNTKFSKKHEKLKEREFDTETLSSFTFALIIFYMEYLNSILEISNIIYEEYPDERLKESFGYIWHI